MKKPIINSLLDNDLYKFTQGQAVARHYPDVNVKYKFFDRNSIVFPPGFYKKLDQQIQYLGDLKLADSEYTYLREDFSYFSLPYLDILKSYRFNPHQVQTYQCTEGKLHIDIQGPWYQTIYWECVLMAIVSELYFIETKKENPYNMDLFNKNLRIKTNKFAHNGLKISEFGTRRRFSFDIQKIVLSYLKIYLGKVSTSNTYFAHLLGLEAKGTMAHEWIMAHGALFGCCQATTAMLKVWSQQYQGKLGIALPDTFTTSVFLRDFNAYYARLYDGVRWDSGCWRDFTNEIIAHYEKLDIDPKTKRIVYTNNLDADTAIQIHKEFNDRIQVEFGIGTFLSNDVGVKPLNIVIKMTECNGMPVVKLSDDIGKATGTSESVKHLKTELGLS